MIGFIFSVWGVVLVVVLAVFFWVVGIVGSAASSVLSDEFKVSAPDIALNLVGRALGRLPAEQRADWEETWLADLVQFEEKPAQAVWYAFRHCFVASFALARELRPALQPAGRSAAKSAERTTKAAESPIRDALERANNWATATGRSAWPRSLAEAAAMVFLLPVAVLSRACERLGLQAPLSLLRGTYRPGRVAEDLLALRDALVRAGGAVRRLLGEQRPARAVAVATTVSLLAVGVTEVVKLY